MLIGLTGGIASGKSTVAATLERLGAIIIDADVIAREVVKKGEKAWKEIVVVFGTNILKEDGEINRKKLADLVFSDSEKLKILNRITHPRIIEKINQKVSEIIEKDRKAVIILVAPLLIETGLYKIVDEVWVVYTDNNTQLKRLMERDGLSREEAEKRIGAQIPIEEKLKFADVIIDNSGDLNKTYEQLYKIWEETRHKISGGN